MLIKKRRILRLDKYLSIIPIGSDITFGVYFSKDIENKLLEIGFTPNLKIGECILPDYKLGPVSRFNAQGKYKKFKDKPKVTYYRHGYWKWKQWCGRGEKEERSKIVSIPYMGYQRKLILPPGIELFITNDSKGRKIISVEKTKYIENNKVKLKHTINLFLEIFGSCIVFDRHLNSIYFPKLRKLNWEILPRGEYPWEIRKKMLQVFITRAKTGNQIPIKYRFERINSYKPDFMAAGRAGFEGYVVFGFENEKLHILESLYSGNATYIFKENWETLSQKSKAEIIKENLQEERIIHSNKWDRKLENIMKKELNMAKIEEVQLKDNNGNVYNFNVYKLGTKFKPIGAIYVILKNAGEDYDVIYIGQTGNLDERFDSHHKQECFEKQNADFIGIHREDSEEKREDIEKRLIDYYIPICNG